MGYRAKFIAKHAEEVMSALGRGHTESVYHKAMVASLSADGVPHRSEVFAPITFKGQIVGMGRCDLIVGNLIVEFKALSRRPKKASHQVKKYLSAMGEAERKKFQGIVVNFNQSTGGVDVIEDLDPNGMLAKLRRRVKGR